MFGGPRYACNQPVISYDPPYVTERALCLPAPPPMPEPIYNMPGPGFVDPHAMNPYGMDPYGMDPYGMDPYGMDPRGMDPYGMDPRGMDPRGMDPYGMDPYGMDPYGMDPYGMDPYGYYDALQGMGYYGPWPQGYYEQDSDSDDEDCCRQRRRRRCCQERGGGTVTKGDINALLNMFQQSVNIDGKKEHEKKVAKKAAAKKKRDLLLREVLGGDERSRSDVAKIDFGGGLSAICPPKTKPKKVSVLKAEALHHQLRHASTTPNIVFH